MAKAMETNIPKMRIEEAAARRQARIDSDKEKIVGVNIFVPEENSSLSLLEVDNAAVTQSQWARLKNVKETRDAKLVRPLLTN